MTNVKHTLQKEIFLPTDERLLNVVNVTKPGKKKKASLLCIAVTTERPVVTSIYQVKKSDRGDTYKKKLSWFLKDLKQVDGKDSAKEIAEFDLHFEKVYKWVASNLSEKDAFIACLWKLSQRHLSEKPEFVNIPIHLLEEIAPVSELGRPIHQGDDISVNSEDYQALSTKEEADLESLMSQCEFAISNAEAFSEQLSKDLSSLDGANIHSIMASEGQVLNLMRLLENGIREASVIENKLESYDQLLQGVKDSMEIMKDKDALIHIQNKNHQRLLEELDSLVCQLDLEHCHVKALLDGDLTNPNGIYECTAAAEALQTCMAANIHPALVKMSAVQEQQKLFNKLKSTFVRNLSHHLNCLFIQQGNEMGETLNRCASELRLPQHHTSHRDLTPYAEVMLWLKNADPSSFSKLAKVYTENLSRIYDREVKEFVEAARQRLMASKGEKKSFGPRLTGSSSSLNKSSDNRGRSASIQLGDSDSYHGSDVDLSNRTKFDQVFDKVLSELEPVCLAEQDFCVKFFHLTSGEVMDVTDILDTSAGSGSSYGDEEDAQATRRKHQSQRQMNEEIRRMMGQLFPCLETELTSFISFGHKQDAFNSLYMLVRMSQHVVNAQDTGSFLSMTFASCLVQVKRNFDRFVQLQIQSVLDFKISKKTRCGILQFVKHFEDFATQAENIFQGSDRRANLEKAYTRLVRTIFEHITRISAEPQKSPQEVVMMENFHRMYAVLSQLKISCLDQERKEAKQKYVDNQQAYVTAYLGRPMEKLNTFFEGVEARVAQGVKREEVSYQLAFSKTEVRKVIKEYPGKEVKKGLEHLKKKVEKHLCDEENLFQVVWHSMQDEFIKQYKYFEQLINQCYPGSNMTLEFKIDDLLNYFSEIAQSH
ncbi:exocyst complex component 1-like isoform X2 [Lineus longissimus]